MSTGPTPDPPGSSRGPANVAPEDTRSSPRQGGTSRLTQKQEAAILVGAITVFIAVACFKAARHTYPVFDDVDFLDYGQRIRASGGPLALLRDLFAGKFVEANRHPLYLAILALFARADPAYHREAQVLAVALAVSALVSSWWVARRHFGSEAAAVVAAWLAGSGALVWTASRECPDALLVALWTLSVGAILDGAEADDHRARWAWARAGAWAGLAYLTKGPGLFMPICAALTLLVRERLRALRDGRGWSFASTFLVVASPLLVRNVRVYGSPLYTANGRLLWVDRLPDFAEIFAPHADARLPRGAVEYFAQVTPGHIAWRAGMGFGETIFHLGDAMALVAPKLGGVLHVTWVVVGVISAAVAVRITWRAQPSFKRSFVLVMSAWYFTFLVFYNAVAGASRYFMPLTMSVLIPVLGAEIASAIGRASPQTRVRWIGGLSGLLGLAVVTTLALDPDSTELPRGQVEVQDWLVKTLRPGEVYAVDARTHLQPRWLLAGNHQMIVSASWQSAPVPTDEMVTYLCENKARYVVLDGLSETGGVVDKGVSPARYFFYDLLPREADGSLPLAGFPRGFRPVYVDPESPRRWMVLETSCAGTAP